MSKVYRLEKPAATLGEERLTPKRTASCPHAAFQLHSKPQPGSDAVARVVGQCLTPTVQKQVRLLVEFLPLRVLAMRLLQF
jgi:hypothetical protein